MTLRKAFDGEVYYWYEDGKSRQVKSRVTATSVEAGRDVMTNEKDANVIHNLFYEYHYADDLGVIKRKLSEYVATARKEEREAAFKESAESIVNEAGKVGQLMDLASASARKEERASIKSMLEDYFKHFFCTCHGSTRTGGHFASCPITIRDEVLGRLNGLEVTENRKGEG